MALRLPEKGTPLPPHPPSPELFTQTDTNDMSAQPCKNETKQNLGIWNGTSGLAWRCAKPSKPEVESGGKGRGRGPGSPGTAAGSR